MIFLVIFSNSIVITVLGIGVYGYLKGILSPPFDEGKMTLNYEKIGKGSKKVKFFNFKPPLINFDLQSLFQVFLCSPLICSSIYAT